MTCWSDCGSASAPHGRPRSHYKRARLVHQDCGHAVKLGYFCPECGERARGAAVAYRRV